jgi:hypothetical protein
MGFSLQTASMGYVTTYTNGTFSAQTDTIGMSNAPDGVWDDTNMRLPWRTSTSVAFQLGKIGMISLQYDYAHIKGIDDMHSLRAGVEFVPTAGMYINAGYAYESSFKDEDPVVELSYDAVRTDLDYRFVQHAQWASLGLGYRGAFLVANLAYQYRWETLHQYATEMQLEPLLVAGRTHRVVFTLGWRI